MISFSLQIPSGTYHSIYTISVEPSSFVYVYMNRTALALDGLLNTFLKNMDVEYNQHLLKLKSDPVQVQGHDEEALDELAVNLTLIENSKSFRKMLLNQTTLTSLEQGYAGLQEVLAENGFNESFIYKQFVDKFHTVHAHKLDKASENLIAKAKRKIYSHVLRFKQR